MHILRDEHLNPIIRPARERNRVVVQCAIFLNVKLPFTYSESISRVWLFVWVSIFTGRIHIGNMGAVAHVSAPAPLRFS